MTWLEVRVRQRRLRKTEEDWRRLGKTEED
jgi:hypothetical protein